MQFFTRVLCADGAVCSSVRALLFVAASLPGFGVAMAQPMKGAYTTQTVNLRAGPERGYPVVAVLRPALGVSVYGCVRDYSWCDVEADGARGWAYAQFLSYPYERQRVTLIESGAYIGLPVIAFSIAYWDLHYRGRPWYRDRPHWAHRPPPPVRPRPPPRPPVVVLPPRPPVTRPPPPRPRPPVVRPSPGPRPPVGRPDPHPRPPVVRPSPGPRPPGPTGPSPRPPGPPPRPVN